MLVDTNVVSELARPRPNARVVAWFSEQSRIHLSVITLDVTPAIARASGELRAARETSGRRVAMADMLIAATALAHGLTLVTRNVRDFRIVRRDTARPIPLTARGRCRAPLPTSSPPPPTTARS